MERVGKYPFMLYAVQINSVLDQLAAADLPTFARFLDDKLKCPSFVTQVPAAYQTFG